MKYSPPRSIGIVHRWSADSTTAVTRDVRDIASTLEPSLHRSLARYALVTDRFHSLLTTERN
ncbi:hypothetical protein LC1Hm_1554 [Halomicrobium sp. LC1Hm]|nr:hypothetical protein LC1Hm_1554 [Halomicrobium sp. LC1Hm]